MNYNLDSEEQALLDAYERAEFVRSPTHEADAARAVAAARATMNKTRRVNLRLAERDYYLAHIRALEEGLPYQTLLASVIHKYLTGRLVDAPATPPTSPLDERP